MLIIDNNITDPWFNIAAEDYLFRNFNSDIFMIYVNSRSVIIGKHQNPAEEVNVKCLREENIPMIRRISGGGTVYHDEGNLNYTYIRNTADGKQIDHVATTAPLISFLVEQGVKAYAGEKNEIRTDGMKISGNAEHVFKNRVLHHGTILYSADLELMSRCLAHTDAVIKSRAVRSNRARVGNLEGRMTGITGISDLKERFLYHISVIFPGSERYKMDENDMREINKIKQEKFITWDWNYAWGPDFSFSKSFKIGFDDATLSLDVSKGVIRRCSLTGP
ncbi:MAG: lipoate--protein ligase, partial [Bacteroidales bacterium]|nr:lipoate--protein ligase [Bacteroidales bacterium]